MILAGLVVGVAAAVFAALREHAKAMDGIVSDLTEPYSWKTEGFGYGPPM